MTETQKSLRNIEQAQKKVEKASAYRQSLPPGSSRARVTTANARLNTACEALNRYQEEYDKLEKTK
jgi:hypothetical protein